MTRVVREPIQVYLTPSERETLDEEARRRGVSRSEALRQGIAALGARAYGGELGRLVAQGIVTPPRSDAAGPPPAMPVTTLDALLVELDEDRAGR